MLLSMYEQLNREINTNEHTNTQQLSEIKTEIDHLIFEFYCFKTYFAWFHYFSSYSVQLRRNKMQVISYLFEYQQKTFYKKHC